MSQAQLNKRGRRRPTMKTLNLREVCWWKLKQYRDVSVCLQQSLPQETVQQRRHVPGEVAGGAFVKVPLFSRREASKFFFKATKALF